MTKTENKSSPCAMAFHHQDGLVPAWKYAMKFAGKDGRIATMPDIVEARIGSPPRGIAWESYFTTLSAEYFGLSKRGNPILIVAHGIGPMSTLDGIQAVYSWEYKDKSRDHRGGRITNKQFLDLEAGKYGPVQVIDIVSYCNRYQYPFIQILRESEALTDPLLNARLGSMAQSYISAHARYARQWHQVQAGLNAVNRYKLPKRQFELFNKRRREQHENDMNCHSNPFIIQLEGAANCSYGCPKFGFRKIEPGYALAHLISTGRLTHMHHEGHQSLVLDISCHEWWNGVRLVGIKFAGGLSSGLVSGPDAHELLSGHWRELFELAETREGVGFCSLMKIGEQWFTQYPKQGERMDTWEPEYRVTSVVEVGSPVLFRTTVGAYYGFFKYGINEVQAIAPPSANSYYFVSDPKIEHNEGNPTHHSAMIQFCQATPDTTKRLMRVDELAHNYDKMMSLASRGTSK